MRTAILAGVLFGGAGLVAGQMPASRPASREKRLIEFGWDEPDPAFMRKHIAQLKRSPFDGCVFHVNYTQPGGKTGSFTWECWSKRAFTATDLQPALDDLKATDFGRFRHNFLRFNTTPADIDWFDDFGAILQNAKLAATLAREAGLPGLLFDIEQYNGPLFNFRKQRDAATKSWDQYAAQVRRRGREVMTAFQEGYPGLEVFLTFGYCLPWVQSERGKKPLADCDYGLLAPFLDGLVEGARGPTRLIDGVELAYGYHTPERFAEGSRGTVTSARRSRKVPPVGVRLVRAVDGLRLAQEGLGRGRRQEESALARGLRQAGRARPGGRRRLRVDLHRDATVVVGEGAGEAAGGVRPGRADGPRAGRCRNAEVARPDGEPDPE